MAEPWGPSSATTIVNSGISRLAESPFPRGESSFPGPGLIYLGILLVLPSQSPFYGKTFGLNHFCVFPMMAGGVPSGSWA